MRGDLLGLLGLPGLGRLALGAPPLLGLQLVGVVVVVHDREPYPAGARLPARRRRG